VDLVELVQDEDFIARSRQMAVHSTAKRAKMTEEQWQADQQAFGEILAPGAAEAYQAGIAPDSAEGAARATEMFEAWCTKLGRPATAELRASIIDSLTTLNDERSNTFWQLVGVVGDRPELATQLAPMYESMQWLIEALRAGAGTD
jgi:hypothetical protein